MAEIAKAYVTIKANRDQLRTDLTAARGDISGFASTARSILGAIGMGIGIAGIVRFGKAALQAAARQEASDLMLAQALREVGDASASSLADMQAFAAGLQRVTTHGDEAVQELMALGIAYGNFSGEALKQATAAALGLARIYQMDLRTAMRYYALAQQGEFTMMQRYIPALRMATTLTEKLAILKVSAARGMDREKAAALGIAGAWTQAANAYGDFQEKLGKSLGPSITATLRAATGALQTDLSAWQREVLLGLQEGGPASRLAADVAIKTRPQQRFWRGKPSADPLADFGFDAGGVGTNPYQRSYARAQGGTPPLMVGPPSPSTDGSIAGGFFEGLGIGAKGVAMAPYRGTEYVLEMLGVLKSIDSKVAPGQVLD